MTTDNDGQSHVTLELSLFISVEVFEWLISRLSVCRRRVISYLGTENQQPPNNETEQKKQTLQGKGPPK